MSYYFRNSLAVANLLSALYLSLQLYKNTRKQKYQRRYSDDLSLYHQSGLIVLNLLSAYYIGIYKTIIQHLHFRKSNLRGIKRWG